MRKIRDYVILLLKGMAMGAADVVPGVSGGTIAFISGIYEELIDTINKFNLRSFQTFRNEGLRAFWTEVNGNFLVAVLCGIAISILTLAKLIAYLLEVHPVLTWSFFFGLVLASIPLVGQRVSGWKGSRIFAFVAGAIFAFLITSLPPVSQPDALWYLFVSGSIAICAMILPGISGSFILILLGSYFTVLDAVNERELLSIAVFISGAIVGLLVFSRFLKIMFSRFHDITVAVLSGFLLGSLNKIWPWKNVLESVIKHQGKSNETTIPIVEENVLPWRYAELTGEPSQVLAAIALAVVGIVIIFVLDRAAVKKR